MFLLDPAQNSDHLLHPVSGSVPMHDLQYAAAPSDTANWRRGGLISIKADGLIQQGLDIPTAMPMFAICDSTDYDAAADQGNTAGGTVSGFVATGGYELKTTEVDLDNHAAVDYTPNLALVNAMIADVAQIGKVAPAAGAGFPALENIVGTVSRGVQTDVYDQSVLYFWPEHLPART